MDNAILTSEIVVKKVKRFFSSSWNEIVEHSVNFCVIIVDIDMIHESVMLDTDYKSKRRTKDTERKHLKRKKAKENQIPKIQKDNENLAGEDEEYSVEKVLGKRLGKKGTIGKLITI